LRATRPAFASGWSSSRNAHVGEGIDETRINDEALAIDDPSFRRDGHVFPDGSDGAAGEDDGGIFDGRPGNGHHSCPADGKVLRLAALCE
jgi:hypothetical protein